MPLLNTVTFWLGIDRDAGIARFQGDVDGFPAFAGLHLVQSRAAGDFAHHDADGADLPRRRRQPAGRRHHPHRPVGMTQGRRTCHA